MKGPFLSVVIPTYRRDEPLCDTLRAVLGLSYPEWELLVVDQSVDHTPETLAVVKSLPARARWIRVQTPSLPGARNVGAREARGDVVLYLDDDIEPLPTLLEAHARHYADPSVGGVAGRLIFPRGERKPLDPRYGTSSLPWLYIRFDQDWGVREVESAPGGNMSFRRALVQQLGGFDENFIGNAFREETDFCLRMRTTGHRIRFDPEAAVLHHFGTPGGCDNIRLGSTADPSARYYHDFARNNMYCFCKHVPAKLIPGVVWDLYRAHVGNRAVLRKGVWFWWERHVAFLRGMRDGMRTWQRHRRPVRETV